MVLWQPARIGEQCMGKNAEDTEGRPKEAVAQLKASIANVATLPKTAQKAIDTADR